MLLMPLILAGACSAPVRTVALRVVDSDGNPIPGAHVRAIALRTSPVPLPVSGESLEQFTHAREAMAASDNRGVIRLTLHDKSPHLIEVFAPPIGPNESDASAAWRLDAQGRNLTPARRLGPSPPQIQLEKLNQRSPPTDGHSPSGGGSASSSSSTSSTSAE